LNASVFRNLGSVDKWGIDGSIAYNPFRQLTVYAFGSWNDSKIKDDIQVGLLPLVDPLNPTGPRKTCDDSTLTDAEQSRSCAYTSGHRESGSPKYTFGFSALGSLGPFDLGITAKRTGPRFIFDNGQAMYRGDVDCPGTVVGGCPATTPVATPEKIFDKTAPAYWLVSLDARYNLAHLSPQLDKTYFQLNVYNLFDKFYVGGFSGGLSQSINAGTGVWGAPPFVQIGAPRTISGTLNIGF
jgi:iron complex outermembrane receptor protein